jgi:hypothetical protein
MMDGIWIQMEWIYIRTRTQHEVAECSLEYQANTHLLHAGSSHTGEDGSSYFHCRKDFKRFSSLRTLTNCANLCCGRKKPPCEAPLVLTIVQCINVGCTVHGTCTILPYLTT